jgi:hypothetical protein
MAKASRKKAKKKAKKAKKSLQPIIDILNGVPPREPKPVKSFMEIYWAEESEVPGQSSRSRTGS